MCLCLWGEGSFPLRPSGPGFTFPSPGSQLYRRGDPQPPSPQIAPSTSARFRRGDPQSRGSSISCDPGSDTAEPRFPKPGAAAPAPSPRARRRGCPTLQPRGPPRPRDCGLGPRPGPGSAKPPAAPARFPKAARASGQPRPPPTPGLAPGPRPRPPRPLPRASPAGPPPTSRGRPQPPSARRPRRPRGGQERGRARGAGGAGAREPQPEPEPEPERRRPAGLPPHSDLGVRGLSAPGLSFPGYGCGRGDGSRPGRRRHPNPGQLRAPGSVGPPRGLAGERGPHSQVRRRGAGTPAFRSDSARPPR